MQLQKQRVIIPNVMQSEALTCLEKFDKNKGIVVMPTGTGKTFLASMWFQKELEKNPNAKLLFICHNKDILSQANEKEFKFCLKDLNIECGYYNAQEKNIKQATFGTVQTLVRNLDKFKPKSFDYIIVDECHHYQAKSFKKVLQYFKPKFMLGLTATPNRMDGKVIYDIIGDKIYEGKIFDAIKWNILSKINYYCVDNDIDFSNVKINGKNYSEKDLNKTICVKEYDNAILKEYKNILKKKFKKKKTICFCATVEHVYRMTNLFNKNGFKTVGLTGKKMSGTSLWIPTRNKLIKNFKNGDYDIVFVRDLFNEGVDIPDADSIMMLRPTLSHTIFTQQIGRGLRKHKDKKDVLILDFTGNAQRCSINFEVLKEMVGVDIIRNVKNKKGVDRQIKEITMFNNGCNIRLSKRKIDVLSNSRVNREILIQSLKDVEKKVGRIPTIKDYDTHSNHSHQTFYKYYGTSWYNIIRAVYGENCNYKFKGDRSKFDDCPVCNKQFKNKLSNLQKTCSPKCSYIFKNIKIIGDKGKMILKEYNEGTSLAKMGKYYKISPSSIGNFLRNNNVKIRTMKEQLNMYESKKNLKEIGDKGKMILKDYNEGKSIAKIGKYYKINEKIINKFLKNNKIKIRTSIEQININRSRKNLQNITIVNNYKPKIKLPKVERKKADKKVSYANRTVSAKNYVANDDKNEIRSKILSKINEGDTILLLESPKLLALKEIEKLGIKPKKIIIPNHLEFKKLAEALKYYETDLNIECVNTSVLQYLIDSDEKFDFVWLDYCGAFSYYMRDLDVLFKKHLKDMRLILTYNLFDLAKVNDSYYFPRVIDYVLDKVSGRSKIRLLNEVSYRYKKNMYNLGFEILKTENK